MAHGGRARGEMGPESSVGATKGALVRWGAPGSGRRGEVAHGGRARGEMGWGHQRALWEQQNVHWFPLLRSLKNLTTGLIWLVTRVGVGRWPMEGGQRGRRGRRCAGSPFLGSLKNLTAGLIWLLTRVGGSVGRWPMEGGQGGRPESSVGATKGALVPPFWLP